MTDIKIIKIMAAALDRELQAHGILGLGAECEAIMTAVLDRTAEIANTRPLNKREAEELTEHSS